MDHFRAWNAGHIVHQPRHPQRQSSDFRRAMQSQRRPDKTLYIQMPRTLSCRVNFTPSRYSPTGKTWPDDSRTAGCS
eukprot:9758092-Alexandrium_andersonii.AAC.1